MTEFATGYRWGHFVLLSLAAGMLFVNRLEQADREQISISLADRFWVSGFLILAICCLAGLIVVEAMDAIASEGFTAGRLGQFLYGTWVGKVALARAALILCAIAAYWIAASQKGSAIALALAVAALAILPAGGHAISAEPRYLALVTQGAHAVACGLWLGGLLVLAAQAFRGRFTLRGANRSRELLERFSSFALPLMALAILTGISTAALQVGRPAALFGTTYGGIILVKVAVFLTPVLILAAHLRFVYLKSAEPGRNPWRALTAEGALALCVVLAAALLAQTIPARHDDIVWLFSFRFAPEVAWQAIGVPETVSIAVGVAIAAVAVAALTLLRYGRDGWRPAALVGMVGASALAVAATNLTVEAYPTTFARSGSTFGAQSVAAGRAIFEKTCVGCHGDGGRGDGPHMPPDALSPDTVGMADLTAAHTNDHTIGDLFWWISEGKPRTAMPGFGAVLSDIERWQLIDYLRVLSAGYQARLIDEHVVPNQPWLPSIDFPFQQENGDLGSLKSFRDRSAVLLAVVQDPTQLERITYLKENADALAAKGLEVIVVGGPSTAAGLRALANDGAGRPAIVTRETDDAVFAWSQYRRTLQDPDTQGTAAAVPLLEFLIDRFGYVRARWRSPESNFADVSELETMVRQLADEPQILPPPDEHAH